MKRHVKADVRKNIMANEGCKTIIWLSDIYACYRPFSKGRSIQFILFRKFFYSRLPNHILNTIRDTRVTGRKWREPALISGILCKEQFKLYLRVLQQVHQAPPFLNCSLFCTQNCCGVGCMCKKTLIIDSFISDVHFNYGNNARNDSISDCIFSRSAVSLILKLIQDIQYVPYLIQYLPLIREIAIHRKYLYQ